MKILALSDIEESQKILNCITADPINLVYITINNTTLHKMYETIEFVLKFFMLLIDFFIF